MGRAQKKTGNSQVTDGSGGWQKQPPCLEPFIGCLNCGGGEMQEKNKDEITADMDTKLYNGFGGWRIKKDKELIYEGPYHGEWEDFPMLMEFEHMARNDPDHDWRAILYLPLRDATYQRQGRNRWVLISSGPGFA